MKEPDGWHGQQEGCGARKATRSFQGGTDVQARDARVDAVIAVFTRAEKGTAKAPGS